MGNRLLAILVTISLAGAVALAQQQVSVDFDGTYDYAKVRTFAPQIASSWGNPLGEKRVLERVEQALVAKGWTRTEADTADVAVMIHGATETRRRLTAMYGGGPWRFGGMGSGSIEERDYTVGTLLVDIFDVKTKALLFRASARGELSDRTEKNQKKVEKAIAKMFKDFPPPPGKPG